MKVAAGLTLLLVTLPVFIDANAFGMIKISPQKNNTSVYYNWTERLSSRLHVHVAALKRTLSDAIMTSIDSGLWILMGSKYGLFTPSINVYQFSQGDDSVMGIVSYGTPGRCFIRGVFENVTFASTAAILASRNGTEETAVDREKVYLNTTGFVSSAVIAYLDSTAPAFIEFLDHQCLSLSRIYHTETLEDAPSDPTLIVNSLTKEIHIKVNP